MFPNPTLLLVANISWWLFHSIIGKSLILPNINYSQLQVVLMKMYGTTIQIDRWLLSYWAFTSCLLLAFLWLWIIGKFSPQKTKSWNLKHFLVELCIKSTIRWQKVLPSSETGHEKHWFFFKSAVVNKHIVYSSIVMSWIPIICCQLYMKTIAVQMDEIGKNREKRIN